MYQVGDMPMTIGTGILGKGAEAIFDPPTNLFHGLMIGEYIPEEDDYQILESIASGVRTGRLSWYGGEIATIFRINHPDSAKIGRRAWDEFTNFGRWGYDYVFYLYLPGDLIGTEIKIIQKEHRVRRIQPRELPFRANHSLYCTEGLCTAYRKSGWPIVEPGVTPIPAAIVQSFIDNKLTKVPIEAKYFKKYVEVK
jgi:hypothetical protein